MPLILLRNELIRQKRLVKAEVICSSALNRRDWSSTCLNREGCGIMLRRKSGSVNPQRG